MKPNLFTAVILVIAISFCPVRFLYSGDQHMNPCKATSKADHPKGIVHGMSGPVIVVTPDAFVLELPPGDTVTRTMHIANTGNANLEYTIGIEYLCEKGCSVKNQEIKSKTFAPGRGRSVVYVNQTGHPSSFGGISSQTFTDYPAYSCTGADDFDIPPGAIWNVNHVFADGMYSTGNIIPAVDVVFCHDSSGYPGTVIASFMNIHCHSDPGGFVNIFLPATVTLTEGRYWVSVAADMAYEQYGQWYWRREADPQMNNEITWQNPGGGYGGCTAWCYGSVQWPGQYDYNFCFALSDSMHAPPPTGWLSTSVIAGTVPAGETQDVIVTLCSSGLDADTYYAMINVNSNDTAHPQVQVPATLTVMVPVSLPFLDDFSSGSFQANNWTFDPYQANWNISATGGGNPVPSAGFGWSMELPYDSYSLVTPLLDASGISGTIALKYDIKLYNHGSSEFKGLAVEAFNGAEWILLQDYTNLNGSFDWATKSIDITALAAGHTFKVRFRVYATNTINLNWWGIDNVKISEQVLGNLDGTVTRLSNGAPIVGALVTISNGVNGTYSTTTNSLGYYNITSAETGSYDLLLVKAGYNPIFGNITVYENQTTTANFAMIAPVMSVHPLSINDTTPFGTILTREITVSNNGDGTLEWNAAVSLYDPKKNNSFPTGDSKTLDGKTPPWLTLSADHGWLPAGSSEIIIATLDATSPPETKDYAYHGTITFTSDPDAGTIAVPVNLTVSGSIFGILEGSVFHDGVGVPNAMVKVVRPGHTPWSVTTNANGSYQFAQIPGGTCDVMVTAGGYIPVTTSGVVIIPDTATTLNVNLHHTPMTISPGELEVELAPGQVADRLLNIANMGDEPFAWSATARVYRKSGIHIPVSDGNFPRGTAAPSAGRAPVNNGAAANPFNKVKGSTAYAFDIWPNNWFFSFDTDDPGSPNVINGITNLPSGGSFDAINADFLYVVEYNTSMLQKVMVADGTTYDIGLMNLSGDEFWTGLTCDKTTGQFYAISTNLKQSSLYLVDINTGATTVISPTGIPGAIDCAIDGTGQMYAFDIVNDEAFMIDKTTGASTLIGSIGFDANYAQGMGWDPLSDNIYLAAYNNATGAGEFRIMDRVTGNTTLIGNFAGETDALAFPGGGSTWLSIDPENGYILPGNSQNMTVHFDAANLWEGYYTGTITFTSDPDIGTYTIPITLSVGYWFLPQLSIEQTSGNFGHISMEVHAWEITNMGSFQFTIEYNPAHLAYSGVSDWYPGISDALVSQPYAGKLTFVWAASTGGITIPDNTFFNLDFDFDGSLLFSNVWWSDNPTPREFADFDGNLFVPVYYDGFVVGTGIPEKGSPSVKIFPNPASEVVNVKSDFAMSGIEVISYLGQRVYTQTCKGDKEVQMKVSALPSGIYFVKVNTEQGVGMVKVAVEH